MRAHNDTSTSVQDMLSSLKDFITNLNEKNKKIDDTLKTTKAIEKKLHDLSQFNDNTEEGESLKGYYGNSEYNKIIDRLRLENATIRELKEERGDLRVLLQDYHNTLEVVMKKHRQIVSQMSAMPNMEEVIRKMECKLNDACYKVHGDMIFSAVANEVLHDLDIYENANRDKDAKMARLEYENEILYGLLFSTFKRKKLFKKSLKKTLNGNSDSNDTIVDEDNSSKLVLDETFLENNDDFCEDEALNLSSQSGYDSDDSIQTVIYRNDEPNK
ncbi:Suppressor of IKBKE 1 family-containing protein [Strongyloides ratti]|uniref:Suppressor of IKBKE 1 family-containing protein n=1 Tax=Strongyloides ratti TaxID=34506 RepID=A0A090LIP4_STRRB|nr:Suppressor of IKBKE 1 family-containing protein [Strongyloides ratti]CEF69613.1 Suppressor of IKBKE 1 family-containing protein [Strongyloides ratti]